MMKKPTVREELISILGYDPGLSIEVQAEEWRETYPNGDLEEWVDAMFEIGALR